MHIGLIGGIGPAATEFYYRGLVRAQAARHRKLDLTIVNAEVGDLLRNLMADARNEQAEIFSALLRRLQSAGADVAAITSLAGHFCLQELSPGSPLTIISAIDALADHFSEKGVSRIGLLGTLTVMSSRLYGGTPQVEIVLPQGDDLQATHANYTAMAASGEATAAQRDFFFRAGARMCREQGAEAVLLAGTDLFLAFDGQDCGFPVIDGAQVHIDRLVNLSAD